MHFLWKLDRQNSLTKALENGLYFFDTIVWRLFLIFTLLSACGLCCEALCKLAMQLKCLVLLIAVMTAGFIHEIIMATKLH